MSTKPLLQIAIKAHQAGRWDEATSLYLSIIKEQPDCFDAFNLLGILYAEQKQYDLAVDILSRAIQQDPLSEIAHAHLAICLLQLNNAEQAIKHLEKAIDINPNYAEAYNYLGNVYQHTNQLTEAKNYYKQAANLKCNYIDAWINLGTVYLKMADNQEARYYFNEVIKYYPEHPAACFQLGNIAYQQRQLEVAASYYEKIPAHEHAQINLGSILLEKQAFERAITTFKMVLARNPKNLLAHSNLAAIYVTQKQHELAIPHYYEILSQDTENYTAHFNLGAIYMQQRKWETAAYHLNVAIELKDDDPDAHDNYATSLLKLHREELAEKHYLRALALRPDDKIASYRLAALTGNNPPDMAPEMYIELLFNNYAENFDHELMDALQYKVPEAIYKHACHYFDERNDLKIVDLGCGTGLCGGYFVSRAQSLIGVDLSKNMLKIAKRKLIYDELVDEDMATALTRWHEQMDLLTAADSFVYVGNLSTIFKQAHQALVPDGYLIFTIEAGYERDFQLMKTGRYIHHTDYVKRLAEQTGFETTECISLVLREEKGSSVNGRLFVLKKG